MIQHSVKTGEAVFHDLRTSVYEIYQEAVQRVRSGAAFQAYRIIYENEYYPNALNESLWSSIASEELAKELPPAIAEEVDGRLNCALLLNGSPNEGILLHQSGKKLICAYYPPITRDFINKYDGMINLINMIADRADGIPLYLMEDIRKGKKSLKDILLFIAAQLKGM